MNDGITPSAYNVGESHRRLGISSDEHPDPWDTVALSWSIKFGSRGVFSCIELTREEALKLAKKLIVAAEVQP